MNIKEIAGTIVRGEKAIRFPLKSTSEMIFDSNNNHILDIRGWGRLQYHEDGSKLQDGIAEWVVKTLNKAYEETNA